MKAVGVTLFALGLLIAGSEGPYFPAANIGGVILLTCGMAILSRLNKRGLL